MKALRALAGVGEPGGRPYTQVEILDIRAVQEELNDKRRIELIRLLKEPSSSPSEPMT